MNNKKVTKKKKENQGRKEKKHSGKLKAGNKKARSITRWERQLLKISISEKIISI